MQPRRNRKTTRCSFLWIACRPWGVTAEKACQFSTSIIKDTHAKPKRFQTIHDRLDATRTHIATNTCATFAVVESYGRGGLVESSHGLSRTLNLHGLAASDLKTCAETGEPWGFSQPADCQDALHLVRTRKPSWIIVSQPCTALSQLNVALNLPQLPNERIERTIEEGRLHPRFVIVLYQLQMAGGQQFLHERPAGAASWKASWMLKLLSHKRVTSVVSDQCEYGLTSPTPDGRR